MQFEGKRVLFIGQVFYDYHEKIILHLERLGALVDFYENKLFREDPQISKDVIGFLKRKINPGFKENYTDYLLQAVEGISYDFLFCVGGFSITKRLIENIRKRNPGIKVILYLWDSFSTYNYSSLLECVDKAYSFEPADCEKYKKLRYLQLFYTEEYLKNDRIDQFEIDLFYLGTLGQFSINRLEILRAIETEARERKLKTFFWLYYNKPAGLSKRIFHLVKLVFSKSYRDFIQKVTRSSGNHVFIKNSTLTRKKVGSILAKSKCVIDIPIENQTGLTIRTIEALAAGKKVITTNKALAREAFFDSDMMYIADEDVLPKNNFLNCPTKRIDLSHLHIQQWLQTLFSPID